QEITSFEPHGHLALEGDPALALQDDREAGRVMGSIAHAPTTAPSDGLRNGSPRPKQRNEVAQGIHRGRSMIRLRPTGTCQRVAAGVVLDARDDVGGGDGTAI